MVVVDNAVYVRGERVASPSSLDDTYEVLHEKKGMAWIGLYRPDEPELHSVAAQFGLHELVVEDALSGHQRPKIEHYGETLFAVFKAARYLDVEERVEFGEVHVVIGTDFAITVRHSETPDIGAIRQRVYTTRACSRSEPSRCSTPSSTKSSMGMRPSSTGCRTTSTKSTMRSSPKDGNRRTHLCPQPRGHRVPASHEASGRHPRIPVASASEKSATSTSNFSGIFVTSRTTSSASSSGRTPPARYCRTPSR